MRTRKTVRILSLVVAVFGVMAAEVLACRIIPTPMPIVRPPHRPARKPLETRSHNAEIVIKGPVATVSLQAVFYNPNPYVMEGTYFFPLEANAAVDNFEMDINGKMVKGELLDADKARGIYEGIVRKMKDPGLLEFVGTKMLKCRVYPMNPNSETKVKLTYSLALKAENGLYAFTYPLRSAKPEAGKIGTCAVRVRIEQPDGIKTVYSPTHTVDTVRKGDNEASLGFEQSGLMPERDFKLYFNVSKKDVGLAVLTHKPAAEDGTFLLGLTPKVDVPKNEVAAKSLVFVADTSGSMAGEKMRQAKGALRYCVNSLSEKDTFTLIPFSTEARAFRDILIPATKENVAAALEFIDRLEARGGTAIDEALTLALKTLKDAKGLPMVVFLTDGLPTIGETNADTILANAAKGNTGKARLFVFGVGYDVNVKLLDRLAEANGGAPDYVTPKENIEVKVSNFYQKVASPVLADVKLETIGLKTLDVYPKKLPDLFRGMQIMVLGRFQGGGHKAVKLSGTVDGKPREFVFETNFAETKENNFLPRLWATRKVAYLLNEIRLHGKNKELVDEVVRLGKRHGIMTPYTSFLVVEDSMRPQLAREMRRSRANFGAKADGQAAVEEAKELADATAAVPRAPVVSGPAGGRKEKAGASQRGGGYTLGLRKGTKKLVSEAAGKAIAHVADKTFYRRADGVLVDSVYDEAKQKDKIVEVKHFSDAYFKLLKDHAGIGRYLAEGKPMILVFEDKVFQITKE